MAYKQSHLVSIASGLNIACWVYQLLRDRDAVAQHADAAVSLSTEHEFAYWGAMGAVCQGWALIAKGLLQEGIAKMNSALDAVQATGGGVMFAYFQSQLAEAYARAGHLDQGMIALTQAQTFLDKSGERWWQSELHRIKGELAIRRARPLSDDRPQAEECFQRALTVSRAQSAKSLELRAATSLARLWQKDGKQNEAQRMLSEIYGSFSEGFDTADLRDAKVLLEQIQSDREISSGN
jgi:adenylate cyclase